MNDTRPGQISDWSDEKWDDFKDWLKDTMRDKVVKVIFIKADGTERVMNCTLESSVISEGLSKQTLDTTKTRATVSRKPTKSTLVTVWDVENQSWKNITVKNITNVFELMLKYEYKGNV
jgi:WYL_2, Sm-like SH3 beta-barrel fold